MKNRLLAFQKIKDYGLIKEILKKKTEIIFNSYKKQYQRIINLRKNLENKILNKFFFKWKIIKDTHYELNNIKDAIFKSNEEKYKKTIEEIEAKKIKKLEENSKIKKDINKNQKIEAEFLEKNKEIEEKENKIIKNIENLEKEKKFIQDEINLLSNNKYTDFIVNNNNNNINSNEKEKEKEKDKDKDDLNKDKDKDKVYEKIQTITIHNQDLNFSNKNIKNKKELLKKIEGNLAEKEKEEKIIKEEINEKDKQIVLYSEEMNQILNQQENLSINDIKINN
jgi:hypothetical protein